MIRAGMTVPIENKGNTTEPTSQLLKIGSHPASQHLVITAGETELRAGGRRAEMGTTTSHPTKSHPRRFCSLQTLHVQGLFHGVFTAAPFRPIPPDGWPGSLQRHPNWLPSS